MAELLALPRVAKTGGKWAYRKVERKVAWTVEETAVWSDI